MAQQYLQAVIGVPEQQQARARPHGLTSGCAASSVSTVSASSGRLSSR
jgi:hypothetical protein